MNINEFKNFVKKERTEFFPTPHELVYECFSELEFDKLDQNFFFDKASYIVEQLRVLSWEKFQKIENSFSQKMYEALINVDKIEQLNKIDSIKWFTQEYSEHIYALSLSNTQSRRSRAGGEFEYMIELILMGANISFDTQGSIGSGVFESKKLAKLVDCVVPGAAEYVIHKRNTSLISAKTTLRERWQEVGDEMSRTKAREMYLATLDNDMSVNKIELISKNNIILVVPKELKNRKYSNSSSVLSFEDMLEELATFQLTWNKHVYSTELLQEKKDTILKQIEKFEHMPFIVSYYKNKLDDL